MSQTTHAAADTHAAANGKPKAKSAADKAHDMQMLLALLVTDWLHGDRHYQAQLTELAVELLKELGGDPHANEPTEQQLLAQEAAGRLEGMPTGIRPAQDQPAMRHDEARAIPTKAA